MDSPLRYRREGASDVSSVFTDVKYLRGSGAFVGFMRTSEGGYAPVREG